MGCAGRPADEFPGLDGNETLLVADGGSWAGVQVSGGSAAGVWVGGGCGRPVATSTRMGAGGGRHLWERGWLGGSCR
jgi:hypothetical protein